MSDPSKPGPSAPPFSLVYLKSSDKTRPWRRATITKTDVRDSFPGATGALECEEELIYFETDGIANLTPFNGKTLTVLMTPSASVGAPAPAPATAADAAIKQEVRMLSLAEGLIKERQEYDRERLRREEAEAKERARAQQLTFKDNKEHLDRYPWPPMGGHVCGRLIIASIDTGIKSNIMESATKHKIRGSVRRTEFSTRIHFDGRGDNVHRWLEILLGRAGIYKWQTNRWKAGHSNYSIEDPKFYIGKTHDTPSRPGSSGAVERGARSVDSQFDSDHGSFISV
eukprot:TRINITY_DN7429_c0_g2_i8.p1 TRINITY_DN7429_c0_g2~~TRINITY_DN7429_c0_g2_i8.p1  ORF type:complete len:294 (-),score=19.88 TRINITY_DN7429_c0_g2_i8:177-1028(-)